MGDPKALTAALALALALGCASLAKLGREPGERLASFPETVWKEYACAERQLPFVEVEKHEIVPRRIQAGGELAHRLVYALCPARATEVVRGRLTMRIRFKGAPLVSDDDDQYELKPGRWVIDSLVGLPEGAEAGIYAYEVEFASPTLSFQQRTTFQVLSP